ncbi:hypothetical protein RintRC_3839 [Richelia intracellularis]|nr:hypothetical protein RintRC_3839 [Richelia intracellularis]
MGDAKLFEYVARGAIKKLALLNQGSISLNFQRFINGFKS